MLAARGCIFWLLAAKATACGSRRPGGAARAASPPMADMRAAPPGWRGGCRRPMYQGLSSGRRLALALAGGREHQRDLGPVLAGLLGDLGQVGDVKPLAVEHQVVQRPPGRAGHVIGELDLGFGCGLAPQGPPRPRRTRPAWSAACSAAVRRASAAASSRCAARLRAAISRLPAERGRSGRGQVAGHARQLVVAGPPGADRPGERGGGRLRQVAEEAEPGLLGRVGVVELLHRVAPALDVGPQLRGLTRAAARRRPGGCTSTLSRARSCPRAATRTLDGSRAVREVGDGHRVPGPAALRSRRCGYPRAVREDGHAGDRRVHRLVSRPPPAAGVRRGSVMTGSPRSRVGWLSSLFHVRALEPGGTKVRHLAVRPWRLPPAGRTRRSRSRPRGRCCRGRRPG